jgi:hypothetical protein
MTSENPWFLITYHEIEAIQMRLHSIEGELPGTCRQNVGEIAEILHDVRDRQP